MRVIDLPVASGDVLGDLSGIGAVVHEEEFNVFFVSDEELAEARSEHVSGLLSLLGANLGLSDLASEASSHAGVDTSLLSPRSLENKRDKLASMNELVQEKFHLGPRYWTQHERLGLKK